MRTRFVRTMASTRTSWAIGLGAVALTGAIGCNAILDNQSGQLVEGDASAAFETSTPDASSHDASIDTAIDHSVPVDGGASFLDTGTVDTGVDHDVPDTSTGITCSAGQKLCDGTCVSATDPLFGCAATSCAPCALPRGSAVCAGGACAIGSCNAGYADCNQTGSDGCEVDLSEPSHCGSCNAVCAATAPNCAPSGGGFGCTTGCSADAPTLCGNTCVDLLTSDSHCGGCNTGCAPVANGTTACSGGTCSFTCGANFHACGGACASNTAVASCGASCVACVPPANGQSTCDGASCGFVCNAGFHACGATCAADDSPASCGASCGPCASGPNGTATCTAGACGIACAAGFADCNGNPSDGCEVDTKTDPAHCGVCATSCGAQACNGGVCAAPPVDAGPPDTGVPDGGITLLDAGSDG